MKRLIYAVVAVAVIATSASAQAPFRPDHTFSIVARDPETGNFGVAVQTHWFNVGSRVIWAAPGVGAVATQSLTLPSYGPLGLELMRAGKSAKQTLAALTTADEEAAVRQVAMIDANGVVATHTGARCIAEAGHHEGDGYSVQANLMEKKTVWDAMAKAYEKSDGSLAERLLDALDAAQAEGGDIRGKQSAAILIVSGEPTGAPWTGVIMDLRVEDHPEPLPELRRLVEVHRAYEYMDKGDEYLAGNDIKDALEAYGAAAKMMPDNPEIKFWAAITMMSDGHEEQALAYFREVFKADPKWKEVVRRLPASELLDPTLVDPILEAGK
jgi:uncharacterized Ntn-hydrolase superfamily protein